MKVNRTQVRLSGINKVMRAAQPVVNAAAARISARAGAKFRLVVRPHRWTGRAHVEPAEGQDLTDADVTRLLRAVSE